MNIYKAIFSFFVIFFVLGFILSVTYLSSNRIEQELIIPEIKLGVFPLSDTDDKGSIEEELLESKYYKDTISRYDKAIFFGKDYQKDIGINKNIYSLGEGIYFFDIQDMTKNHEIHSEFFEIEIKSPGRLYLDTRDEKEIKVFSFDSLFGIKLIEKTSKKVMTSWDIYPHIYFGFNGERNKYLENADILRIESLTKIQYITQDIISKEAKEINPSFYEKLYMTKDMQSFNFFGKKFIDNFLYEEMVIGELENVIGKNKPFFGEKLILKYKKLFVNPEKKISYLLKEGMNVFLDFIHEENEGKINTFKGEILSIYNEINEFSPQSGEDFESILKYYYSLLTHSTELKYIEKREILTKVLIEIQKKQILPIERSSIVLNKIYYLIDIHKEDREFLSYHFIDFLNLFLEEKELTRGGEDSYNNEDILKDLSEIDNLVYFLKNIFIFDMHLSKVENIENILSTYKIYLDLISLVEKGINTGVKTETILIENHDIFTRLLDEIRGNFFLEKENSSGLLELSSTIFNRGGLRKLDEIYTIIYDFYQENKGKISSRNAKYNALYLQNKSKYEKYSLALTNYPEYQIKYDEAKNKLLSTQSLGEKDKKVELSKNHLFSYFSQFEGISTGGLSFTIKDNYYYEVKNLVINGSLFSFDLYPGEFYRIDGLVQDGRKLNTSYELESIKDDLKELYEKASDDDKHLYDFKRFFLNTFFSSGDEGGKIFEGIDENILSEDRVIRIFKRDKLFGSSGDFTLIDKYLAMNYEDVIVEQKNNIYNIDIQKGVLKMNIDIGGNIKSILGELQAQYVFSEKDHYFKNISIIFFEPSAYESGNKYELFGGKKLSILRPIQTLKFKEDMERELVRFFQSN